MDLNSSEEDNSQEELLTRRHANASDIEAGRHVEVRRFGLTSCYRYPMVTVQYYINDHAYVRNPIFRIET
jgi:hypothetical protein